jgi:hypothetical protein
MKSLILLVVLIMGGPLFGREFTSMDAEFKSVQISRVKDLPRNGESSPAVWQVDFSGVSALEALGVVAGRAGTELAISNGAREMLGKITSMDGHGVGANWDMVLGDLLRECDRTLNQRGKLIGIWGDSRDPTGRKHGKKQDNGVWPTFYVALDTEWQEMKRVSDAAMGRAGPSVQKESAASVAGAVVPPLAAPVQAGGASPSAIPPASGTAAPTQSNSPSTISAPTTRAPSTPKPSAPAPTPAKAR